jgi:membrane peptidoglycan carboxypeptidase
MSDPQPPAPSVRARKPRWLSWKLGVLLGALVVLAAGPLLLLRSWMREGAQLARAHARHETSHPGWSFPARIHSAPVPLDAPKSRLLAEAKERGYLESCDRSGPGTFCARTGSVVPRRGDSLEPVLLGWIIGPDAELREHLPISEAPQHLLDAIIAAEDRDFWSHRGVNLKAVLRATLANVRGGGYTQGGSTLSMQVVRAFTQRRERTLWRKVREFGLALGLERELGKRGVLQAYLDAPYLGQHGSLSVCGFRAAARHYFGKDARELTLAEAAALASSLPSPGKLSPHADPELTRAHTRRVLRVMADRLGYRVDEALASSVSPIAPEPLPERHAAYLSAVRAWLSERLPPDVLYGVGLSVETGIDLPAQAETERLFAKKIELFESVLPKRGAAPLQAAALALEVETGMIRAIWGGTDASATGFNRATQARRQAASSFKPVVYALAFTERNADGTLRFTASSTEPNSPRDFRTEAGRWRPRNVGGEYSATASLAHALVWSQNIATASLLDELGGPRRLIDFAARLGFDTSGFPEELGLALGQAEVTPLEMTQFAAVMANGGRRVLGAPVRRAVDAAGRERVAPPRAGEAVLDPESAGLTRELMRLVIDEGTGGAVRGGGGEAGYGGPALGKTGTSDREKDLWFVGSTPSLAASVWIGYDRPVPIGASASDLAAPLWGWWMSRLTRHDPARPDFPAEPRIIRRAICTESGLRPNETCRALGAPFLPGSAPRAPCPIDHSLGEDPERRPHESLWKRLAGETATGDGDD